MKDRRQQQLKKELLETSASAAEVKELLPIASKLSLLKDSNVVWARSGENVNRWSKIAGSAVFTASGLALGMFLIIIAQAALPTSWLYPVQKFSDNVAISVHPQYRVNIMMKRAQQVNELVTKHAEAKQVLTTLADYTKEANAYKSTPHANYAAFEYCKTNLQQAEESTVSPVVRQAISNSLKPLETT